MKRLALLITIALGACAMPDPRCPALPEGGRYCLQSRAGLAPFDAMQNVRVRQGKQDERMIATIEADARGLNFAGLTPYGQKILQLHCADTGGKAVLSPHERLDPGQLCALLQLTLWPTESVRAGLQSPLRLEESPGLRAVYAGETLVYSARYQDGNRPFDRMELRMPTIGLAIDIEEAEPAR
jgi:hypothetical protein